MHPLSLIPWDDDEKPVVSCKSFKIEYIEEEQEGILTDRIIALGSSYLDRCPTTGNYVLCKCNLTSMVTLFLNCNHCLNLILLFRI